MVRLAARLLQRCDLGEAGCLLRAVGVCFRRRRSRESAREGSRERRGQQEGELLHGLPRKTRTGPVDEFKLIDSEDEAKPAAAAAKTSAAARPAGKPAAPAAAAARSAPQPATAKRALAKGGGRVGARERRGPQTLEETLEILGAGELEVDNGNGETLNDTGVRHLRVEVQKNTPFSRLLERLSERTKKN